MKRLGFLKNYNTKLDSLVFTTIRKRCRFEVGEVVEVYIKGGHSYGPATVISRSKMPFWKIPKEILMVDTGLTNPDEIYRLFDSFYNGARPID